ncbi:MAG: hypothetical protein RRC34_01740 [Lentisphaeria bacterium]|nr:hypothetical protein [Lentisphaeria bacterium]
MRKNLKKNNKRLISLSVISALILGYLIAQVVVLRPSRVEARAKRKKIDKDIRELVAKGWPLNEGELKRLLSRTTQRRDAAERQRAALFQRAGQPFQTAILERFGSPRNFQQQISRLDYQEEFKRLENYLTDNRIVTLPEVFKLSEDTVGLENYKLVLQLWTIEAVVKTAYDKGLRIAYVPAGELAAVDGQPPARVSDLGAMPIVPYLPVSHVTVPYLLRIPVRARVSGTVEQLHAFLTSAATGDVFFTVDHIQARKPIPPDVRYSDDRIEAVLECSTFYILDSESGRKMMKKPEIKLLPSGA